MFEEENDIHDTAEIHITARTKMGTGNKIGAFTVIGENVIIGDNNIISNHVTIGNAGEVRGMNDVKGEVIIGDNNVIREYTSIQSPQRTDYTIIDNDCFIMDKCHIAHDNIIESGVTIAPQTTVGGCVLIQKYANIGMGCNIRQRLTVGESSMLGMGSVITKDVPPFETWYGNPAKGNGLNLRGLAKRYPNKTEEELIEIAID